MESALGLKVGTGWLHTSEHEQCLFHQEWAVYILYTDHSILTGPDRSELD